MSLKDLNLEKSYDSDKDNLLREFYIPALSQSVSYKRLAGFFSSGILSAAASGISEFIKHNGKMQLIIGLELNEDDYDAVKAATINPEEYASKLLMSQLEGLEDMLREEKVEALGWMLANDLLQIKIGMLPRGGIFHLKVGILEDSGGNKISFSGSDNETPTAWRHNIEEFKVFRSWVKEEQGWFLPDEEKFNRFWEHRGERVIIVDLPEAIKMRIIKSVPKKREELKIFQSNKIESKIIDSSLEEEKVPSKEIKLRNYQNEAIENWIKNNYKGIFEMATGTGKTLTAISCIEKTINKSSNYICVISVPYKHLIDQWHDGINDIINTKQKEFRNLLLLTNNNQIQIGSISLNWKRSISNKLLDIQNGLLNKLIIYTTHNTLSSEFLIDKISKLDGKIEVMIIVDEVHGVGAPERQNGLLERYNLRLGLSATPKRWMDEEGTGKIFNYFKDTVFEFPIERAIKEINPDTNKTYLTPYDYHPYDVDLTEEESQAYIDITKKISQLYTYKNSSDTYRQKYNLLLIKRANIIKSAKNKLEVFKKIIKDIEQKFNEIDHVLVYCNPGEQFNSVQDILSDLRIKYHKFTNKEGTRPEKKFNNMSERKFIIKDLVNGDSQALVAMKCLDEGIDIPSAKFGVILASSTNPREFIQRRGRILRPAPNKDKSYIYDIIVLPPKISGVNDDFEKSDKNIIKKEFYRYKEFSRIADNSAECLLKLIEIEKKLELI